MAGSPNGLLFRSVNGGREWSRVPFPLESGCALHAILPDPAGLDRFLVAVSPHTPGASGLLSTADGGRTWRQSPAFSGRDVWALARQESDPRVIAAGAGDGAYLSRDGGERWERISPASNADLAPVVSLAFHPTDPLRLFAGTTHLPWLTTDGGASWRSVHRGMIDDSDVFAIHVDRDEPARVFASACSGMYRSADGGAMWTKLRGAPDASFRTYAIARSPSERNVVWAGTSGGLIRSDDSGSTWRTVLPRASKAFAFDAGPASMYVATSEGVFRGEGGGFEPAAKGFAARDPRWLAVARGSVWTASSAEGGGLFRSGDGSAWKRVRASNLIAMAEGPGNSLWGMTPSGVFRSAADGAVWTAVPAPPGRVNGIASDGGGILLATRSGLYRAPGGRLPWKRVETGIVGAIQTAGADWAIGARSAAVSVGGAWTALMAPAKDVDWYGIAAAGGAVLAATSHGLFRSADAGRTWEAAPGSLGFETVTAVLFHPRRPGVAFAAQHGRVFASADGGRTWRRAGGGGLEGASIRQLAVAPGSERLLALASGRGIYFADWEN